MPAHCHKAGVLTMYMIWASHKMHVLHKIATSHMIHDKCVVKMVSFTIEWHSLYEVELSTR